MSDFEKIVYEFSKIPSVRAIALSGSTTAGTADEDSDFDVYVYTEKEIPVEVRACIAQKYAQNPELDNRYWETGDEMIISDTQKGLDIMYRSPEWIEGIVRRVYDEKNAAVGYTTAFLHNISSSEVLYDKNGWFSGLQNKINAEYPDELAKNIIKKNFVLLRKKKYSSFYDQIKNALKRGDFISVNHRTAAFLASYFDTLFAFNRVYHPGEKRLLFYAKKLCKKLPDNFEEDFSRLFSASNDEILDILASLEENLRQLL